LRTHFPTHRPLLAVLTATLALLALPAAAGSTTGQLAISATVIDNCAISSATALSFGAYDPAVANRTGGGADLAAGNGALAITCTRAASTAIGLSQGLSPASGSTDAAPLRQLRSGNAVLGYRLYQDAGTHTVWGNAPGSQLQRIASGRSESVQVYGVIPKGQDVPAGNYGDLVVVTVTF
jgi:spore coat protein U-like protein